MRMIVQFFVRIIVYHVISTLKSEFYLRKKIFKQIEKDSNKYRKERILNQLSATIKQL